MRSLPTTFVPMGKALGGLSPKMQVGFSNLMRNILIILYMSMVVVILSMVLVVVVMVVYYDDVRVGLLRCGKSCRLRWINYLRTDLKRGNISVEEEEVIIKLHGSHGNRLAASLLFCKIIMCIIYCCIAGSLYIIALVAYIAGGL